VRNGRGDGEKLGALRSPEDKRNIITKVSERTELNDGGGDVFFEKLCVYSSTWMKNGERTPIFRIVFFSPEKVR